MISAVRLWDDAWNNIIRDVIFEDEELLKLMKIPEDTSIVEFEDRYFIRAGYTNKLLRDEAVRIVYSRSKPVSTSVGNVSRNEIVFDIYVKIEDLHNVTNDRLQLRTDLIANRLYELLTDIKYKYGYNFHTDGGYDLGTRTIGYARYCFPVWFFKTH